MYAKFLGYLPQQYYSSAILVSSDVISELVSLWYFDLRPLLLPQFSIILSWGRRISTHW
jgi:hypothetical protein